MKKLAIAILSIPALGMAVPAIAQQAAAPEAPAQSAAAKAGDTVYDAAGEVVGTIESVDGQNAVISTGSSKATVPLSGIATGPKGLAIGLSKAQFEEAVRNAGK